jgi:WD40 repeat protein
MTRTIPSLILLLLLLVGITCPAQAEVSFSREIAPILLRRCAGCHGDRSNLGNYRVNTFLNLLKKGDSGIPGVVPGKPAESSLFQRIETKDEYIRMPQSDDPLEASQIALVRRWITEGAKFDGPNPSAPLKSLLGPREHPAAPAVYRTPVPVLALAFAPGGKTLAVGSYNEITLWDVASGNLVRRIPHLPQRIQALTFSKDGAKILIGGGTPGEYGEVALVEFTTGKRQVLDTFNDIVLTAAFSADGERIAAGGSDASVRVFDSKTGQRLWTSNVHSDWVTSVSFSADQRFVASASKDMTVKVYDTKDGALFTTYSGHNRQIGKYKGQAPVYSVQFGPEAGTAISAGGGNWIQVWDPVKAKDEAGDAGDMEERFAKPSHARYLEHGFTQPVFALTVRDGQIFAASGDGRLKQFDLSTGKEVRAYSGQTDWVFGLDIDTPSHRVAAGSYSGEVRIWDTQTGLPVSVFKAQPGTTTSKTGVAVKTPTTP